MKTMLQYKKPSAITKGRGSERHPVLRCWSFAWLGEEGGREEEEETKKKSIVIFFFYISERIVVLCGRRERGTEGMCMCARKPVLRVGWECVRTVEEG